MLAVPESTVGSIVVLVSLALSQDPQAKQQTFSLGGPRRATVALVESSDDYRLDVRFLPVSAFDRATNSRLNLGKAKGYALRALAAHLAGKPAKEDAISMTVSGLEINSIGRDNDFLVVAVSIPRDKVQVQPALPGRPESRPQRPASEAAGRPPGRREGEPRGDSHFVFDLNKTGGGAADLLTRKADTLDTLQQLTDSLQQDAAGAGEHADETEFLAAVAGVEERAVRDFRAFDRSVNRDDMLLSVEKEEVHKASRRHLAAVLACLRRIVSQHQTPQEKPQP